MFQIVSDFKPSGDQPHAIQEIVSAFQSGKKDHVLLGVTGSGKTFTMANVIKKLEAPTLVVAPNKTLAAQLYLEFKSFFPNDAVGYFISYYDYFQPEAYVPSSDTYIAKDSSINEDIDKMRHEATQFLFEKKHTVIVASVSCIYGLGSPQAYLQQVLKLNVGQEISRDEVLRSLIDIQYNRNDMQLQRGHFRVRGDLVDVLPAHQKDEALRISFFGDEVESLHLVDALTGKRLSSVEEISIYPGSHYVTEKKSIQKIVSEVLSDLGIRLRSLHAENKLVEAQRLEQRTMQDVEAFEQLGFCPGIENYSRYLTGKKPGEAPPCLLDYFPKDFLTIIDESHITVPQIRGMYRGDRARKQTLVDFGFRLPSALDNRPLSFDEFKERCHQVLYVSATPGSYEYDIGGENFSEQIIRPTGLLDPEIEVVPASRQVDDLVGKMKIVVNRQGRVLVTTLTKKMSEDLCTYYQDMGFKVRYLHSDIDTLDRAELLKELRQGVFDILIGINLLREGLDLPEVQLVAVMDADKAGFLRSRSSLIQIVGRAARNSEAKVIFYGDTVSDAMEEAMKETDRRREIQQNYNMQYGITPKTVLKAIGKDLRAVYGLVKKEKQSDSSQSLDDFNPSKKMESWNVSTPKQLESLIRKKTKEMHKASGLLEFEKAALLRDELKEMSAVMLLIAGDQ
ncbi:MAG: excinuclease ABC subunit UvrB [Oligoflexales bacterium]